MNQQEQQIPLSQLLNAETLQCKSCGSKIFRQSLVFKKVSKLMAASPTDRIVPIPVLVCDSVVCGSVLTELLEEPLKSELESVSAESEKHGGLISE